jgi:hypothetical protein
MDQRSWSVYILSAKSELCGTKANYKGRHIADSTRHHASFVKLVAINDDIRAQFRTTRKLN